MNAICLGARIRADYGAYYPPAFGNITEIDCELQTITITYDEGEVQVIDPDRLRWDEYGIGIRIIPEDEG